VSAEALQFDAGALGGTIRPAGDKSISHRAVMLAALASGTTRIAHPNRGADVLATRDAMEALGARIEDDGEVIVVRGATLRSPDRTVDARNSGTTTRLLAGICAGHGIAATFDGDASLRARPMERVARPLRAMGATVETVGGKLPMTVRGIRRPAGGAFALELPSAQIKSAILLAHLEATGPLRITGDRCSRDHTERMLRRFGRDVRFDGETIELLPGRLVARDVDVPADLSAAAFFIVAACITPGSDLLLADVGVNPTRTGFLDAMRAMGADLVLVNEREVDGEPVADLRVRARALEAATIGDALVVRAIDEIPILAVAAAHARGTTRIRGAADLRAKESDRLAAVAQVLAACNVAVTEYPDGLDVVGGTARAPGAPLPTFDDHRMAMLIAALAAPTGPHVLEDARPIAVSFPDFTDCWTRAQAAARQR